MRGKCWEKGEMVDLLPCAGITLIRFYGFDLRSPIRLSLSKQTGEHPGKR
jgi:hypothetical protein